MKKLRIVEAHQVPMGNISPDIFALPCIDWAIKDDEIGIIYKLNDFLTAERFHAHATDWICKLEDGKWQSMTNEEYRKICHDTPKEYQPIRGC
jgi:hypothetical protein